MNYHHKIVHIGPFPPPLGGISVYLYRLFKKKENQNIVSVDEKNLDFLKFVSLIVKSRNCLFVYHSPSLKRRLVLFLLSFLTSNKFAYVIHGKGLEESFNKSNLLFKWFIKKSLFNVEFIQVVGQHLKDFFLLMGIPESKIFVENSFLPPPMEEEAKILKTYPPELFEFLNRHGPILVGNASALCFDSMGNDLYGLDMCVNLVEMLRANFPQVGLIFAIADESQNVEYFSKVLKEVTQKGLIEDFFFLRGQKELWPLFRISNLMVRPSSSDGFGISIAEALFFGCKAVASDVSERPVGTVLFRNRDPLDFYEKCLEQLNIV